MAKQRTIKSEKIKGWSALIGAILLIIKVLAEKLFGYEIPQELIDQTVEVALSVITLWGVWRNNYISNKGTKQFNLLKNAHLD